MVVFKNTVVIGIGSDSMKLTERTSCTVSLREGNAYLELTRSQYASRVLFTIKFIDRLDCLGLVNVNGISCDIRYFLAKVWISLVTAIVSWLLTINRAVVISFINILDLLTIYLWVIVRLELLLRLKNLYSPLNVLFASPWFLIIERSLEFVWRQHVSKHVDDRVIISRVAQLRIRCIHISICLWRSWGIVYRIDRHMLWTHQRSLVNRQLICITDSLSSFFEYLLLFYLRTLPGIIWLFFNRSIIRRWLSWRIKTGLSVMKVPTVGRLVWWWPWCNRFDFC